MQSSTELGPLGPLQGIWEGDAGGDIAPSDKQADNRQATKSLYRERMVFEPTGRIDNHEQKLYGLRYSTRAWRIGAPDPFHEELGYWLYEPATGLILRCFMPPRGMTVLAGGNAPADARRFTLEARAGDPVFGICSSPFLTAEFKTVRYTLDVELVNDDTLHYESHTIMEMKGRAEPFDHVDANTLRRVG
ncbi:MAG: heme-binding beta-barrel domain-containing protein [Polyangiaceae bacterium]